MRSTRFLSSLTPLVLVALTAAPALAGPPLVCFPFDIGTARSLPWNSDARTWKAIRTDYRIAGLTGDTLALLMPTTPVIVRMETLRRAAIYATTDAVAGRGLLQTLLDRARAKGAEPMASFDAGYLAATYKQLEPISASTAALASGIDGYGLVQASLERVPTDPAVAFAAALVAADGHRAAALQHERTARAGAPADALLAKNIEHLDHGIPR